MRRLFSTNNDGLSWKTSDCVSIRLEVRRSFTLGAALAYGRIQELLDVETSAPTLVIAFSPVTNSSELCLITVVSVKCSYEVMAVKIDGRRVVFKVLRRSTSPDLNETFEAVLCDCVSTRARAA